MLLATAACSTFRPPPEVESESWKGLDGLPDGVTVRRVDAAEMLEPPEAAKELQQEVVLPDREAAFSEDATSMTLTLEMAINRALVRNRELETARDRLDSSWYSIVSAESAFELKLIPTGGGTVRGGSGTETGRSIGGGVALSKKLLTGTTIEAGPTVEWTDDVEGNYVSGIEASVSQPLLRGLSIEANRSGIDSAEFAYRSSRRALYLSRVDTVVRTVTASYEVVRQRELLRLNRESAARLRVLVDAARAKERLGVSDSVDTYRAEIQLKQAEDNLLSARQSFEDALDNLKILLDLPLDAALDIEAPLTYSMIRMPEEMAIGIALEERVELEQAEDNARESRRSARVAKHNVLPDLDVLMSYFGFGQDDSIYQSDDLDNDRWSVSVSTTTDLMRTAERAAFAQSRIAVRTAERNLDVQRDEIVRQVKRELRSLERSEKRIDNQLEQIRQAEGQLSVSRVKFERGLADNFDVIEAEISLRSAQTELLSAVLDYIVGGYRLRATLGTLLEKP